MTTTNKYENVNSKSIKTVSQKPKKVLEFENNLI